MKDFKIILALADIHIGMRHVTARNLKDQLNKHFFKVANKLPYIDGIFILGDTLHTMLSLNSDYSTLFMWFASKVYKLARRYSSTVVWVSGTPSHDGDQLNNLKSYVQNEDGVDFRIYDTVEEITLWDDYKVLVLPDVKLKNLKDIDDKLIPGKYDMIIGHGLIDQMQFLVQDSENMPTKTYVYNVDKLMRASKGPVLFGHIHQHRQVSHKFYYVGPFTMLERGWTDVGFAVAGIYDKDRTKFKVEHYMNPDSASYYELVVTQNILSTVPIDDIMKTIDDLAAEAKENDLFTLRITRGDESESSDKVMMLETRYRKDRRFSIVKKIKNKKEQEREKEQADRRKKFVYLMDEDMELPSILYTYYTSEVKPTMSDRNSLAATITFEDFERALQRKDDDV